MCRNPGAVSRNDSRLTWDDESADPVNVGGLVMSANARVRWEYRPGSELFVVYNDERDTRTSGFPDLSTRAFIVKINRLFRF